VWSFRLGKFVKKLHPYKITHLGSCVIMLASPFVAAPPPRYGFVGVGTMSSAIVRGMCTLSTLPMTSIVLSPRGAEKVATLKALFPDIVTIAADNQAVLDACDIVFVGVLPKHCEEVLRGLRFQARHTVVSLVSTAPLALLQEVCAPVPTEQVVRAIPLPPVAKHNGATVMTPPHPTIAGLFGALGTVVPVATEALMKKMMPVTALMGQLYAQHLATQQWLVAQGVDAESAAKWTGAVFHTVTYDSAIAGPSTFEELVHEQTPGGLNEQVIREMTEAGAYTALSDSLDNILARIEARPAPVRSTTPYSSAIDVDPE
jgi:pyrroline-5-carboxylate reductase